jgi:pilus assembly protein CpaE
MSLKLCVVGPVDRHLEEVLRAAVGSVTVLAGLGTLGTPAPDVLVIDIRDEPGIPPALSAVRGAHPQMRIILVASRLEPSMMLEAMRAGVNEFLTDPLTLDDVRAALDRLSAHGVIPTTGKMYAFVGAKGGVGTTTVAVNVATALAGARAGRVMLLDLHPAYGDAALFLGAEPRFSVLDALENTHRLDDAYLKGIVVHTKSGVDILASSDRLTVSPVDPQRVRALLDFVGRSYDHLVLDVPRNDSAVLDALERVSKIVIVANQELSTVRGAARMATTLRQRYGRERIQVVVSRYDAASDIGQEDIERATGGKVKHLFPSNYRLAIESLNKGQPIVVENHNKLSASYVGFAHALAGIAKRADTDSAKSAGLFGRLSGRR